jgi:mevalonate pyrophosphate decarboxylase
MSDKWRIEYWGKYEPNCIQDIDSDEDNKIVKVIFYNRDEYELAKIMYEQINFKKFYQLRAYDRYEWLRIAINIIETKQFNIVSNKLEKEQKDEK